MDPQDFFIRVYNEEIETLSGPLCFSEFKTLDMRVTEVDLVTPFFCTLSKERLFENDFVACVIPLIDKDDLLKKKEFNYVLAHIIFRNGSFSLNMVYNFSNEKKFEFKSPLGMLLTTKTITHIKLVGNAHTTDPKKLVMNRNLTLRGLL